MRPDPITALRDFLRDLDHIHREVERFDAERRAGDALDPLLEGLDLVEHGEPVDLDPEDLPAPVCECGFPLDLDGVCLECDALDTYLED